MISYIDKYYTKLEVMKWAAEYNQLEIMQLIHKTIGSIPSAVTLIAALVADHHNIFEWIGQLGVKPDDDALKYAVTKQSGVGIRYCWPYIKNKARYYDDEFVMSNSGEMFEWYLSLSLELLQLCVIRLADIPRRMHSSGTTIGDVCQAVGNMRMPYIMRDLIP